jgi:hypothetical protein
VICVLLSLGVDLTSYHLANIRWTTNYNMKYGSAEISDAVRDAFERCLQHPGVEFHPSSWVDDDWHGSPTFSLPCLTMKNFSPCSLGRKPILHNYPEYTTNSLHHRQSAAMGANMSQLVVTTPSFTSPVIGKSDPMQLPTFKSAVTPLPDSPFNDSWIRNGCQQESTSPAIGTSSDPLPRVTPESLVIPFSLDDPQVKKKPAYFHHQDELNDLSRLTEGHEDVEKYVSRMLLLMKCAISGAHSCPIQMAQLNDDSREASAMFSNGQKPSSGEARSQLKRVLLPQGEDLHSFNASVETASVYKRKKRSDEK